MKKKAVDIPEKPNRGLGRKLTMAVVKGFLFYFVLKEARLSAEEGKLRRGSEAGWGHSPGMVFQQKNLGRLRAISRLQTGWLKTTEVAAAFPSRCPYSCQQMASPLTRKQGLLGCQATALVQWSHLRRQLRVTEIAKTQRWGTVGRERMVSVGQGRLGKLLLQHDIAGCNW